MAAAGGSRPTSTAPAPAGFRAGGFDAVLIGSQIIALQVLHYLILSLITGPILSLLADPLALNLEGGRSNVAMIVDWRQLAGRTTLEEAVGLWEGHTSGRGAGRIVGPGSAAYASDPARAWALGIAWAIASAVECIGIVAG